MAAMDLLGRRWALRILWELRGEPLGARALRSRCDRMSSSVLYERLDELKGAGLITRDEAGDYLLTDLGAALGPALESLGSWARLWSETLREADQRMGGEPGDVPGHPVSASAPAAPPQDYG